MNRNLFAALWVAAMLLCAGYAWGHGQHFTDAENDWLNVQYASDGTKCCDRKDAVVGPDVEWRIHGNQYQVFINDIWLPVPAERVMRRTPSNPWPGQSIVTYSLFNGRAYIWCFWPGVVM
jgi:hypothetical protein